MEVTSKPVIVIKTIYTLFVAALLIGAIVVAYVLRGKIRIFSIGVAEIGLYGAIIMVFLLFQQLFSILNNYKWIPSLIQKSDKTPNVGLQVVGYREDKKLFKVCLDSLKKQDYPNLNQIIVGIDGNEQNDLLMESAFKQVFPLGRVVRLQKAFEDMDEDQRQAIRKNVEHDKFVCISQPHKGKRDIMYTCFHCHSEETELVALTDSDTFWNVDTLTNLVQVMVGHVVNCVSGPLGLYKKEVLQDVSHQWIKQEFLGQKCTYGDDRSLSNRVLLRNMSIFYNNKAFVQTDTPAEMLRWIPQQTRWCKSFYREFIYNIKSFYMHSAWMALELVFQFIYPFFILITLVWFITRSLDQMFIVFFFVVMMGAIRGLFGLFRTGDFRFLHYGIYVFLYILFLIPCKLFAIITLWNNDWGTSTRFQRYANYIKAIHAFIWAIAFTAYIGTYLIIFLVQGQKPSTATAYGAVGALGYIVALIVHWNIWGNLFLIPQGQKLLQLRYQQAGVQIQSVQVKDSGDASQKYLRSNQNKANNKGKNTDSHGSQDI